MATSQDIDPLGPYIPSPKPFECHIESGGDIDAAGFRDRDGKQYVVYKIDGNSAGHGGYCNNGGNNKVGTPIALQQVESDGITKIGDLVQILDRDDSDGPLAEAPYLVRSSEGIYFLFYSSNCFNDLRYNTKYATSDSLLGPYTKSKGPLLQTDDFSLKAPGGASVSGDGTKIMFHGHCPAGRCMYTAGLKLDGHQASIIDPLETLACDRSR